MAAFPPIVSEKSNLDKNKVKKLWHSRKNSKKFKEESMKRKNRDISAAFQILQNAAFRKKTGRLQSKKKINIFDKRPEQLFIEIHITIQIFWRPEYETRNLGFLTEGPKTVPLKEEEKNAANPTCIFWEKRTKTQKVFQNSNYKSRNFVNGMLAHPAFPQVYHIAGFWMN